MCHECPSVFEVFEVDCCHLLTLVQGEKLPPWIISSSEFTILPLFSPDQVLLVGHAGFAGTQRDIAVLIPGEAVLGDAVVSVGEEAC